MTLQELEAHFKHAAGIPPDTDLSLFPLTDHVGFNVRETEKNQNGEVFTPLQIVDRMILKAAPKPNQFNLDLCAGWGQFTIRILRYLTNTYPDFNISDYLTNWHWFNEINPESVKLLQEVFGPAINIAAGPAEYLNQYPSDANGVWLKGVYYWDIKHGTWTKNPNGKTVKTLF